MLVGKNMIHSAGLPCRFAGRHLFPLCEDYVLGFLLSATVLVEIFKLFIFVLFAFPAVKCKHTNVSP